jgi:hypothetical protein
MISLAIEIIAGLWPTKEKSLEERSDERALYLNFSAPGEFVRRLNQSGWLEDEVLAAGALRQGRPPSMLRAATGLVFVEMARRRCKFLPREFVLAATADRVVAFDMSAEGVDVGAPVIKIKRGELGSWPRAAVGVDGLTDDRLAGGGTLRLAGERFPFSWDYDDCSNELVALLRG